jgi:O-antigen ligase
MLAVGLKRRARSSLPLGLTALIAAGLVGNAALLYALMQREAGEAVLLGLLPLSLIVFGALVARDRSILVFGALGLSLTVGALNSPIPSLGGLHAADILVAFAVTSWLGARLLVEGKRVTLPRSPLIGLPLLLFAVAILVALLRGHTSYGAPIGQPLRLIAYPLIALALVGVDSRRIYRGVVVVFYTGTVWMFFNAIYHLGTGTSQTFASNLSTGGERVLALSVSFYLAGALFLALLNLEIDRSAKLRALHLTIAGLALFGVIVAFGRGTFIAVAIAVPLILLFAATARAAIFSLVPLFLPFVILAAIFVPRLSPDIGSTLTERVAFSTVNDLSVQKREEANALFWEQVEDSPFIGVGFGKRELLTFLDRTYSIDQGFHNSWLYLLAGGGAVAVGSFALLLVVYLRDLWLRMKGATAPYERVLLAWSALMLFTLLLNGLAGPVLSIPSMLITIWMLLFLPAVVPVRAQERAKAAKLPPWSRPTTLYRLRTAASSRLSSSTD